MMSRSTIRLLPYLSRQRRHVLAVVGWTAVTALPAVATGRLIASSVDAVITGRGRDAVLSLTLLAAIGGVAGWGVLKLAKASAEVTESIRSELARDVVAGSLAAALEEQRRRGLGGAEINQQVTSVIQGMENMLQVLPEAVAGIGSAIGMLTLSPLIAGLVTPFVIATLAMIFWEVRVMRLRLADVIIGSENVQAEIAFALEGVRDITAYGAKSQMMVHLEEKMSASRRATIRLEDARAAFSALRFIVGVAGPLVVTVLFIPALVERGDLSIGGAIGAVTYVISGMTVSAGFLASVAGGMMMLKAYLLRLSEHAAVVPEPKSSSSSSNVERADLLCRGVTFAYGASAVPIVSNLDLELREGDHLAIVGPSGIGKSTLAALLSGILSPQTGTITLDGVNVEDRPDRSSLIAMVPQESYVFAGTLRENLSYLKPDASDDEILHAAQAVGLDRVLHRLGGLEAQIDTQKSGLSEGERQLVTLVRTYLSSARIVILDEATCYLDPVAEEEAERAFMQRGGTLIVIAHRMSSSLRATRVLIMDGPYPTIGTHEELMQSNDLYSDLHGFWKADAV